MTLQWRRVLAFRSRDAQYQKYPTIIYRHRNRAISVYRGVLWSRQYRTQLHQKQQEQQGQRYRQDVRAAGCNTAEAIYIIKIGQCLFDRWICMLRPSCSSRSQAEVHVKSISPHRLLSLNKVVQHRALLPNCSAHPRSAMEWCRAYIHNRYLCSVIRKPRIFDMPTVYNTVTFDTAVFLCCRYTTLPTSWLHEPVVDTW